MVSWVCVARGKVVEEVKQRGHGNGGWGGGDSRETGEGGCRGTVVESLLVIGSRRGEERGGRLDADGPVGVRKLRARKAYVT